jgi:hypothetical protein
MAPKTAKPDKTKIDAKKKVGVGIRAASGYAACVVHTCVLIQGLPPPGSCLQAAEDKTFGLKNKNKSAKVQKCVGE